KTPGARAVSNGRRVRRRRRTISKRRRASAAARMTTSQFDSTLEQREAALLGMWVFLATEVLFFAPLFFGYVHGRVYQPEAFVAGSHHMHLVLGTLNTALLLTSSFTMALAVRSARTGKPRALARFLVYTALLGAAFLAVKGVEYSSEWSEAVKATGGEA